MKIPKVNSKFLYTYEGDLYIAKMTSSEKFKDIFTQNGNIIKEAMYTYANCFHPNDSQYTFISEVDSTEQAKELYPEHFI